MEKNTIHVGVDGRAAKSHHRDPHGDNLDPSVVHRTGTKRALASSAHLSRY